MDQLKLNTILEREEHCHKIKEVLQLFEKDKNNVATKRGIYIYGEPGTGKTTFIMNLLKELNYDIVRYDAGDIRNKSIIETITNHNMSDKNIMSMFKKNVKKIVIVMDEIDGMNNGDKGGINTLIKLIRPKKTKKQRLEEITLNPIVCVGNCHIDKKIKELMKVCYTVELKKPTSHQMIKLFDSIIPDIETSLKNKIIEFVQADMRKLQIIHKLYSENNDILNNDMIQNIFQLKSYNDDTKKITQKLINTPCSIHEHMTIMNETDRTIVGLLWHENIIDVLSKMKKNVGVPFYIKLLENMCFADYIDRITFQKQIWQFNEMSSLIKTFKNNKLYHDSLKKKIKFNPTEVRFTKVLTKYSTEYNNYIFIQSLCQQLGMDKKDLFFFFLDLKKRYNETEILGLFENYEITKLDINRIYRYLEKYTKENCDVDDSLDEVSVEND